MTEFIERDGTEVKGYRIAVQTDEDLERPHFAVIEPIKRFDSDSLQDWVARRLAPETEACTDGLGCFPRTEEAGQ